MVLNMQASMELSPVTHGRKNDTDRTTFRFNRYYRKHGRLGSPRVRRRFYERLWTIKLPKKVTIPQFPSVPRVDSTCLKNNCKLSRTWRHLLSRDGRFKQCYQEPIFEFSPLISLFWKTTHQQRNSSGPSHPTRQCNLLIVSERLHSWITCLIPLWSNVNCFLENTYPKIWRMHLHTFKCNARYTFKLDLVTITVAFIKEITSPI